MNFEAHELRVVDEARELKKKLDSLGSFFNTGTFQTLSSFEQNAMHQQFRLMDGYYGVLCQRIGCFVLKGN